MKKKDILETFINPIQREHNNTIVKMLEEPSKIKLDKHFIGTLAIMTGIVSFIPIMVSMWITKNHSNFTWLNLALALTSNLLWLYYGVFTNTSANVWSGILYFFIYVYILMFKIYY